MTACDTKLYLYALRNKNKQPQEHSQGRYRDSLWCWVLQLASNLPSNIHLHGLSYPYLNDTLLILSSVHQCLLIKRKIFDTYLKIQSFRSNRSLTSGVSFTTGTIQGHKIFEC